MELMEFIRTLSTVILAGGAATTAYIAIKTAKNFSKQLQLNFFAEYTKRYQEIMLNFPEDINRKDFDFDKLTPDTKSTTLRYMRAYFDLCSEEYHLYLQGHIDKKTWEEWLSGIKHALSKTAFQKGWKDYIHISAFYYNDFTNLMTGLLQEIEQKEYK